MCRRYGLLQHHKPENPHKRMDEDLLVHVRLMKANSAKGCRAGAKAGTGKENEDRTQETDNRECSPCHVCSMDRARATPTYPNSPLCRRSVSICRRIRPAASQDKPQTGKSSQADGRRRKLLVHVRLMKANSAKGCRAGAKAGTGKENEDRTQETDNRECSPRQTPVRGNTLCSMETASKARGPYTPIHRYV